MLNKTSFALSVALLLLTSLHSSYAATTTYTYDSLNRLTKVDYGNGFTEQYTYDAAGNRLTYVAAMTDTAPPEGAIEVTGEPTVTTSQSVLLTLSATDASAVTEMQFSNDGVSWSTPEPYADVKAWSLTSGDGVKKVYVKFKDGAGNWSSAYTTTIILDNSPSVTSTSPTSEATGVPTTSTITAIFRTDMKAATITTSTFKINNGVVAGTVTYNAPTRTAAFTPSAPLAYSTTYTVTIATSVTDTGGRRLTSPATWSFTTSGEASLSLASGWNLMSLPVQPEEGNTAPSSVLSGITGSYDIVWSYLFEDGEWKWKYYDPNNKDNSTLEAVQAGMGYWIHMTSDDGGKLSVSGSAPASSLSLLSGWNLAGYNGNVCKSAPKALSSLGTSLQAVWGYTNTAWQIYDPNDLAGSTLTQFCPNNGYWIKVSQDKTWSGW